MSPSVEVYLSKFWDWVDNRYVVRRTLLGATFTLTVHSYLWAIEFSRATDRTGSELALITAAVTAPVSMLMGLVAKLYNDGRGT